MLYTAFSGHSPVTLSVVFETHYMNFEDNIHRRTHQMRDQNISQSQYAARQGGNIVICFKDSILSSPYKAHVQ